MSELGHLASGPSMMEADELAYAPQISGYTRSHEEPGRGEVYDAYYASDPEVQYLWKQECRVLESILQEFYPAQPPRLLDFACGTGRIASFLETRVASSCGVDVSASMLEVARRKLRRTELFHMNFLSSCPFGPGSFDLITAFRFFLNAEPRLRRGVFQALGVLLASGGCLVFNIHRNGRSLYWWPTRVYCALFHQVPDLTLSIGDCEGFLKEARLRIIRVYPVGLLHLPKISFSERTRSWVDKAAMGSSLLGRLSDSPIIVVRKGG